MNNHKEFASLSPSELLAEEIVDRLVADGIVTVSKRTKLKRGLEDGTLTEEDWGLLVELAADRK
jgi:hypothetical protein